METDRLLQFCRVFETQSISKAAEICGITKSGISRSLKILQDEVGLELITAKGRGIQITDNGKDFYTRSLEILKKVNDLKNTGHKAASLKIGCLEVFSYNLLPLIIAESGYNQFTEMLFLELAVRELEYAVASGNIDWAFTYSPSLMPGIEHIPIANFSVSIYATSYYINQIKKGAEISFVLPLGGTPLSPFGDIKMKSWEKMTSSLSRTFTVNRLSSGLEFALKSKAAIFLPDFLVKIHNQNSNAKNQLHKIEVFKISEVERTIFLAKRIGGSWPSELKEICDSIKKAI